MVFLLLKVEDAEDVLVERNVEVDVEVNVEVSVEMDL